MGTAGMGFGMKALLDAFQRNIRAGLPVFLRIQNSDDSSQPYADLGFQVAVTGALAASAGVQDIRITPQPAVERLSMHDIGIMGGRLQMTATRFIVSDTFVKQQMALNGYSTGIQVWRDPARVIGLQYDNYLYKIESIVTEQIGGETVLWELVCNRTEIPTTPATPEGQISGG